ncbi:MAG: hypothetical protein ACUVQY_08230 [Thermoproteota archaeon]
MSSSGITSDRKILPLNPKKSCSPLEALGLLLFEDGGTGLRMLEGIVKNTLARDGMRL